MAVDPASRHHGQARRSVCEHKLPSVQREWLPPGFPVIRTTACD